MCLITKQKTPITLEEDLIVYKALTEELVSPHKEFEYELNTLYESNIKESDCPQFADYISQKSYQDFYSLPLHNLVGKGRL